MNTMDEERYKFLMEYLPTATEELRYTCMYYISRNTEIPSDKDPIDFKLFLE